jgi:hypothetical protein
MDALYRNPLGLPSLALLAGLLAGCDQPPAPKTAADPVPNVYLEALQEAEALKHEVEERNLQEQRIDELLGRGQSAPR